MERFGRVVRDRELRLVRAGAPSLLFLGSASRVGFRGVLEAGRGDFQRRTRPLGELSSDVRPSVVRGRGVRFPATQPPRRI